MRNDSAPTRTLKVGTWDERAFSPKRRALMNYYDIKCSCSVYSSIVPNKSPFCVLSVKMYLIPMLDIWRQPIILDKSFNLPLVSTKKGSSTSCTLAVIRFLVSSPTQTLSQAPLTPKPPASPFAIASRALCAKTSLKMGIALLNKSISGSNCLPIPSNNKILMTTFTKSPSRRT